MTVEQLLRNLSQLEIKLALNDDKSLKVVGKKQNLTPELITQIKDLKAALISWLEAKQREKIPAVSANTELGDTVATSFAQQRLWFIDSLQGGSPEYNMPMAFTLKGHLDMALLTEIFTTILTRHQVLRSVYVEKDGETFQYIRAMDEVDFAIKVHDISTLSGAEQALQVKLLMAEDTAAPFDLAKDLMLRVSLVKTTAQSGVLLFNIHHIACDGWSMAVLSQEFLALYHAYSQNKPSPLPELRLQYADYAHWQKTHLAGNVLASQLKYWEKQLDELPAVHGIALDYPRPEVKQHQGAFVSVQLGAEVAKPLLQLAAEYQLTPFMLLHGALSLLLSRHANSNDVVVGTPVANRKQPELEALIGFFVNTLVLRVNTAQPSLSAYFNHIRQLHLDAQNNQDVPFEQLVERLKAPRNTAHSPLFQIMLLTSNDFVLSGQGAEQATLQLPGVEINPLDSDTITEKFDISVVMSLAEQGVNLHWNFDVALFERSHIEQLSDHLCRLLRALATACNKPQLPLSTLDILSDGEVEHLVYELNRTELEYQSELTVHQLFEQQVARQGTKCAVVFEQQQLSYAELNQQANRLAHYLRDEHQVGEGTLVGLCVERSLEMIVGLLAIIKAGGCYVPFDIEHGADIINSRMQSHQVGLTLVSDKTQEVIADNLSQRVNITAFFSAGANHYSGENLANNGTAQSLCYAMSSSGTTGKPKLIGLPHQALNNLIAAITTHNEVLKGEHQVLQFASIGFDMSYTDTALALLQGGTLHLIAEQTRFDVNTLVDVITRRNISLMNLPASMVKVLCEVAIDQGLSLDSVKVIVSTAEKLELSDKLKRFFTHNSHIALVNHFGPTETHVCTTYNLPPSVADWPQEVPIGMPLYNSQCYVLDAQQNLVPKGVEGELYVAGDCLADGYLGNPALSAEKFIELVLPLRGKTRVYRTGDLVKWQDGQLRYAGRSDDQIKINGYRIELEDVKQQLLTHPELDNAIVLHETKQDQMVAYYTSTGVTEAELRGYLHEKLPSYMVPKFIVKVAEFKLNVNGKIDKKALPALDETITQGEYVGAQSASEKGLVEIWSTLLNIDAARLSVRADFFDIGGHSLLSIRLLAAIRQRFEVAVTVANIFDNPTIETLAKVIDDAVQGAVLPSIEKVMRDSDVMPVSFAQQRLWFIDSLQGGSAEYNMPVILRVEGEPDMALLYQVFSTIIARHEILRSVYFDQAGETLQRIRDVSEVSFEIAQEDLSYLTRETSQADAVKQYIAALIAQPFDLSCDLMLRVNYLHTGQSQQGQPCGLLVLNVHHIASDGWSLEVLTKEFLSLFNAYSQGLPNPLPELAVQYADYAHWQRTHIAGDVLEGQLAYWQNQLHDLPVVHSVPLDFARPELKQHQGKVINAKLPKTVAAALNQLAKRYNITPFMLLHGALSLLLARHSGSNDIVVGTPVANRQHSEVAPLLGFFVNTLVLRANTEHRSLDEYFSHIREVHLGAQSNQDVPFEQLVERLKAPRSSAHSPLFQIMITTDSDYGVDKDKQAFALPGLAVEVYQEVDIAAKFDLNVNLNLTEQGVALQWLYDTSLFSEAHIRTLNAHLCTLLQGLAHSTPQSHGFDLPMLSEQEIQHLVVGLNDNTREYNKQILLHQQFEQVASQHPHKVALLFGDKSLSYGELNAKANQLAHYLLAHHDIGADTLVGLCVERSLEMMVAILAILKAGGAYVPMDPAYPKERLGYMFDDAKLAVILSQSAVNTVIEAFDGAIVNVDGLATTDEHAFAAYAKDNVQNVVTPLDALAYVIYTSGSTGKPKGVMIEHRNAVAMVNWASECFSENELAVVLASTSLNFDLSVFELFVPLSLGCRVRIVTNVLSLAQNSQCDDVTLVNTVPSAMDALLKLGVLPKEVKVINLAGEALRSTLVNGIFSAHSHLSVCNLYGPSEDTTYSTYARFVQPLAEQPHIGKVIANSSGYILDQQMRLVPYGSVGELYLGGEGVARGYLNRNDLTQERFIANPYFDPNNVHSSARLYRTGDLVRYLSDGNIAYCGRVDHQVKIRGFRIELGEIEAKLATLETIDSALVSAQVFGTDEQLVAYVKPVTAVTEQASAEFIRSVITGLKQRLPEYMVPSAITVVNEWPLTPNGKIDRKALPQPQLLADSRHYVAPQTPTEHTLVAIWAELLALPQERISIEADFFELGGHSLLIIRLLSCIKRDLDLSLDVQGLYQIQHIKDLAQLCDSLITKLQLKARLAEADGEIEEVEF